MSIRDRAKAGLQQIIRLYGVEGVLIYQRLCDEFGPVTVHAYLLELLQEQQQAQPDARRI